MDIAGAAVTDPERRPAGTVGSNAPVGQKPNSILSTSDGAPHLTHHYIRRVPLKWAGERYSQAARSCHEQPFLKRRPAS